MKNQLRSVVAVLLVTASVLCFACPGFSAESAQTSESKIRIEDMVVTGTRSERSQDEIVATVEVLKSDVLQEMSLSNWDDSLNYLAGVQITRPDNIGHRIPINANIRGISGPRQNLILLNGMPINDPVTGFITMHTIPVDAIERIEVVKGPYSSLYGTYAMGGVINVITKRGTTEKPQVTVRGAVGDYDYWEGGARVSGLDGGIDYNVGYNHRQSDNYLWREKETRRVFDPMQRRMVEKEYDVKNRDFKSDSLDVNFGLQINENHRISLNGLLYTDKQGAGVTNYVKGFEPESKTTDFHLALNGDHDFGSTCQFKWNIYDNYAKGKGEGESMDLSTFASGMGGMGSSSGGMSGMGSSSAMSSMSGPRYYQNKSETSGNEVGAQMQVAKSLAEWNLITLGLDMARNTADWKNTDVGRNMVVYDTDESCYNLAPYVQAEFFAFDNRLLITPGLRFDYHSEAGEALSPKLAARFNITDQISIRASGGRAFRAPTLNELYSPTWMMIPGVPFESNPDLKPEYLWSADVGVDFRLNSMFTAQVTGFYSKGDDFIAANINNGVQKYENIDEVKIYGFEAGIGLTPWEWLNLMANYTYTNTEDTATGDPLTDVPEHMVKAMAMANYSFGDFNTFGSLGVRYIGKRYYTSGMGSSELSDDNYTLTDMGIGFGYKDMAKVSFKVKNLFDEDWFVHGTEPGPSRSYWVEVSLTF